MTLQVEKLEKNMAKLTVEVSAEDFEGALKTSYHKNKGKFNIPGFRKGRAPQAMIEKMYGTGIFIEDAANEAINDTYKDAMDESGLDIVSRPEVDIVQVEKGKPFIYTALVAVKPEVTLGEYKGIEVERALVEVTEEDIQKELERIQDQNSRMVVVEDRPVADGDHTVIDFEGFIDGDAFEGGKAEGYPLVIGSHSFIDTFEEQLIGKQIGEECEVNVTFPAEYHAPNLAGKPAQFKVTVQEIKVKELPEINDEFAEEVSEFDTLEEYKKDIRARLEEKKKQEAATENENRVVGKVVENAAMDLPEPMIESQVKNMVDEYARRMQSQGLNLEDYMKFTGMTMEQLKDQTRPEAIKRIKTRLVLEEVVKQENIQASDEAVENEIARMSAAYKMETEQLKDYFGEEGIDQMKEDIAVQEAVDMLVAEAKLV